MAGWPGWKTVRTIGRGANGTVFEIHRDVHGKTEKAALKVIPIPRSEEESYYLDNVSYSIEDLTKRFKDCVEEIVHEYQLMRELRTNPNIVFVDDYCEVPHAEGFGWDVLIKMELLTPLMRSLDKDNPEEQVVKLGKDICNALISCHSKQIVHKDIKPQNIFVSDDGVYKLGDFGIAKVLTDSGISTEGRGTIGYMSPEVYNRQSNYGFNIDIYSLGLVMYWMLNNYQYAFCDPYRTPTAKEELSAHSRRFDGEVLPPPVNGSNWIKQIVLKACAHDSKDRYASAQDMLDALQRKSIIPDPPSPPPENLDVYTEVSFSHENHPAGKVISVMSDGKIASVSIPVNVTDGQVIFAKGRGKHSAISGSYGDLYVTIHIAPPPPPPPTHKWKYAVAALAAVLIVIGISQFAKNSPPAAEDPPEPIRPPVSFTNPEPTSPPVSVTIPEPTKKQEPRFSNVDIGDTVYFGSYEQDNNTGNDDEAIEWVVLDKRNGSALLMSKYALDSRPYHSSSSNVTWEKCSLRQWLNGSFLNSAFSSDEQSYILTTDVSADKNPDFPKINPGSSTQDKIYILSVNEALYYFPDYQDRACTATKYTQSKGVVKCWWWLRTPGESQDTAASINSNGSWDETGSDVAGSKGSVRPVLWVKTD